MADDSLTCARYYRKLMSIKTNLKWENQDCKNEKEKLLFSNTSTTSAVKTNSKLNDYEWTNNIQEKRLYNRIVDSKRVTKKENMNKNIIVLFSNLESVRHDKESINNLMYNEYRLQEQEANPCEIVKNVASIILHKNKSNRRKQRKYKVFKDAHSKLLNLHKQYKGPCNESFTYILVPTVKTKRSETVRREMFHPFRTQFVVYVVSDEYISPKQNSYQNPFNQPRLRVYRCQFGAQEESCCCSCNSDAMFEVMKSLYDCYKKKDCNNCNCILCGHLPREERRVSGLKKGAPSEKLRQAKAAGLLTPLEGKTPEQKEKIIKGLAMAGIPLPEAKTPSEKKLMEKVRTEVGLPPEPKSPAEKEKYQKATDAGIITPLEGKSAEQKEKILRAQHEMGLPLPEGRTASEKALIAKIKSAPKFLPSGVMVPPDKMKKARAAGLLTPLQGKTLEQKEKNLKGMAAYGIPLPEGKTPSEKKLIDKVRADLGLPPEPQSAADRDKYNKAVAAGAIQPLEGKSLPEKEQILKAQHDLGIPLPEGRTPSEKALIAKIKASPRRPSEAPVIIPSEKIRKAKAAGLITPLEGKTPEQKENILKGLITHGIPLPEGKTPSEKKIIDKVRAEVGLPPEAKNAAEKKKYNKALAKGGIITPLDGKTKEQKEKILKAQHDLGIPLPEGRTPSEKELIAKIKASPRKPSTQAAVSSPSEKLRKSKAEGLLTPLEGKTPEQKEKILKGLATQGISLPEGKTPSEKKLIDKVRAELGLPPEPKTAAERDKYNKAAAAGIIQPLDGKSGPEKEKMLKAQHNMGLNLPEGRTPSEKSLIAKIKASPKKLSELPYKIPSEKLRKAKLAGLMTPLDGKTPAQKEKILKGLAMHGIPLPEGKTPSEKKLVEKIRAQLGLPPEPKTASERDKYNKALGAGLIVPLEGKIGPEKEKILKAQHEMGLPLPDGRTPSEKALIAKVKAAPGGVSTGGAPAGVPSEKLRKAKAAGLLTPLEGKTPEQRENILKGLAQHGIPLPEAKTPSEKKLIDKVRHDLGLPPEPRTSSAKQKFQQALAAGLITPLEGKSIAQKEKVLRGQAALGLPLPEGRTPSEKALIQKIQQEKKPALGPPALPPKEAKKLNEETAKVMIEGKGPADECICPQLTPESERLAKVSKISKLIKEPGRITSEKLKAAKAAGLLTPLQGKTPAQKEKIIRGLAQRGLPLPEAKTESEKKLIDNVRTELGLPPEPKTPSMKEKFAKAQAAGIMTPLEGKTSAQKEKILRAQAKMGLPLPEGRTPSEKALVKKIKGETFPVPSEKIRKAKAAGLLTPLEGKSPEQKEKILRGLAMHGIPFPEATNATDKRLINKIRADLGLPPEPTNDTEKTKYNKALSAGIIQPLEGKSAPEKEKILKAQYDMGIPLPEGRTQSEKALIAKIKATPRETPGSIASEKLRKAKAAGLITPLEGKTPQQKEKILRGLAMQGLPLPEGNTSSEKKLIDKVRADLGLPPEPKSASDRDKYKKALKAGIIEPLEGKSGPEKEKILKAQHNMRIPLPEGRSPSEKSLIAKIKAMPIESAVSTPSEKLRKAKAAGLITPLAGKTTEQKEKIIKGLANHGVPLPEGKTPSEKKLIDKVRAELGLPLEPKTAAEKEKYNKAMAAGIIVPLEGKSGPEKEKILKAQYDMGIPLPEGRTPSEKALIAKIKGSPLGTPTGIPSEKLRKAKAAGLLTPLEGKTPDQKEKILKGLAMHGIPLPEGKTPSEKKIIDKVRAELGLPPEPKTDADREKYNKALAAGVIQPLEGKSGPDKEKILKAQHDMGLPMPEGRTPSEKALIAKVKAMPRATPSTLSEKMRKAKAAGLLTPLDGKTHEQKDKILRGLAKAGLPLPMGKTPSEKALIDKIGTEISLPPEPKTPSTKEKMRKAQAAGLITPLEGKSPAQKENILRGLADAGVPLPEGKTASEKSMVRKIRAEMGIPPEATTPSEKEIIKKAKADGLFTPLAGKTPEQKEKIIKGLIAAGLPIPQGKTPSEKELIKKIRTGAGLPAEATPSEKRRGIRPKKAEFGVAPDAITPSEKEMVKKAKAEGLITPLTGKTAQQKEKIIRGLAAAGLPIPEGSTASEKELIKKIRGEAGLPPEPTPSEKRGKIRRKSKRIGVGAKKSTTKGVGGRPPPPGVTEEFEDIIKTTTCDRGCGCDKKKIRFKHSYVKIKVTSPDISSLCPCPNDCFPIKTGIVTDNEGIKVTVGRVIGVPSYSAESAQNYDKINNNSFNKKSDGELIYKIGKTSQKFCRRVNTKYLCKQNFNVSNSSDENTSVNTEYFNDKNSYNNFNTKRNAIYNIMDTPNHSALKNNLNLAVSYVAENISQSTLSSSKASSESFLVEQSDSTLSLSTNSGTLGTISIISFGGSSFTSITSHDVLSCLDTDTFSVISINGLPNYDDSRKNTSSGESGDVSSISSRIVKDYHNKPSQSKKKRDDILIFRLSQNDVSNNSPNHCEMFSKKDSIVFISDFSHHNIMEVVNELILRKKISESANSSVFLVVPTSDDYDTASSIDSAGSTICIQLSENVNQWGSWKKNRKTRHRNNNSPAARNPPGLRFKSKGRLSTDKHMDDHKEHVLEGILSEMEKFAGNTKDTITLKAAKTYRAVSVDTIRDRPCCCSPVEVDSTESKERAPNVASEFISPIIAKQSSAQGLNRDLCNNTILRKSSKHMLSSHDNVYSKEMPVGVCNIPPCRSGSGNCFDPRMGALMSRAGTRHPTGAASCQCSPDKLMMFENQFKELAVNDNGLSPTYTGDGYPPVGMGYPQTGGYPPTGAGYSHPGAGYSHPGAGYPHPGASYPQPGVGYPQPGSGYPHAEVGHAPSGGYYPPGAGYLPTGDGYPLAGSGYMRKGDGYVPGGDSRWQSRSSRIDHNGTKAALKGILCKPSCEEDECATCLPEHKRGSCRCEEKDPKHMKKKRKGQCACQIAKEKQNIAKKCQCCMCKGKKGKYKCDCYGKKKNVCECPEPEPEAQPPKDNIIVPTEPIDIPIDYERMKSLKVEFDAMDKLEFQQELKLKSDMTQTTSGFGLKFKKRPPVTTNLSSGDDMSFEDALAYFQEHPEEDLPAHDTAVDPNAIPEVDACKCDGPLPPLPPPPPVKPPEIMVPEVIEEPVEEEPPLKGFKLFIAGKGSGAKGFSGVVCFDKCFKEK